MNLLVVSPHRDDAAFSLALAMKSWLAGGHRVTVLSVFTRSLSAPFSDADTVHPNDLLSYVSAMRRREDAELIKLMPGLRMIDLNLKDAELRLRCSPEEVYTFAASPEDTAVAKLQKALGKIEAEQAIEAFLIPLGLGHHVDHMVVRNAAVPSLASKPVAYYEDLPDAFRGISDIEAIDIPVQAEVDSIGTGLSSVVLTSEAAKSAKYRIVSVYASQIDDATMRQISSYSLKYAGGERIWANDAWLALFPTASSSQSA